MKILLEKKDYMIVDKPYGMVVHISRTTSDEATLVDVLAGKVGKGVGEKGREGIVHRLDKTTSGVMVVARTQKGYEYFVDLFKGRKIKKIYFALVKGILEHKEGIIDSPISRSFRDRKKMDVVAEGTGKNAVTDYKVLEEFDLWNGAYASFLEVGLRTGRTHQIRVHMKAIGHNVIGDDKYGVHSFNKRFSELYGLERQFLHAFRLEFKDLEGEKVKIDAELPLGLSEVLEKLRS
ncbi:MAG: RluA family pseudouridine synthase [Candidatus Peregrinibacteria bacterium]